MILTILYQTGVQIGTTFFFEVEVKEEVRYLVKSLKVPSVCSLGIYIKGKGKFTEHKNFSATELLVFTDTG